MARDANEISGLPFQLIGYSYQGAYYAHMKTTQLCWLPLYFWFQFKVLVRALEVIAPTYSLPRCWDLLEKFSCSLTKQGRQQENLHLFLTNGISTLREGTSNEPLACHCFVFCFQFLIIFADPTCSLCAIGFSISANLRCLAFLLHVLSTYGWRQDINW